MEPSRTTLRVPEELRGPEAEATGGRAGQDMEVRGAPAPPLLLHQQNLQEAEGVTPPKREVQGYGGASGLLSLCCLRGGHESLLRFLRNLGMKILVWTVATCHGPLRTF